MARGIAGSWQLGCHDEGACLGRLPIHRRHLLTRRVSIFMACLDSLEDRDLACNS